MPLTYAVSSNSLMHRKRCGNTKNVCPKFTLLSKIEADEFQIPPSMLKRSLKKSTVKLSLDVFFDASEYFVLRNDDTNAGTCSYQMLRIIHHDGH